ncbi:hypothetical protein [Nostoc sp. C117]|uniref:hypothetical protein n=1 Tax=Nostoc sp. C117 TaxID=3349875 RepID=UPI00370D14EA
MLKQNRLSILLAAAMIVVPTLLTAPANAQTQVKVVAQSDRDWDRDGRPNSRDVRTPGNSSNWDRDGRNNSRDVRTPGNSGNWDRDGRTPRNSGNWDRDGRNDSRDVRTLRNYRNWNRDNQPYSRVDRLSNGDVRYPNGQIIPARNIIRLRNQGYFRLPNGDILLPNQEIVPAGRLVRVRDDYFRLPDGLVLQINL